MIILFNTDGSINTVTGTPIFQYSAGANTIEIQIDKPQDSTVSISLVKADATALSAKPCVPKTDGDISAWIYTFGTAGSPDLNVEGDLDIAFKISKNGVDLTTEHYTGTVQVSFDNGYDPVDPDTADILQAQIDVLQLDKVGRYNVASDMVAYLPAEIIYDIDSEKTPNNLYFNFTHDVIDNATTVSRTGVIFAFEQDDIQHEWFLTTAQKQYSRTIVGTTVGDFTNLTETEIEEYAYSKDQADARFVHLIGAETIADTKTFSANPIVPDATANTHAVNRQTMYNYALSKEESLNVATAMTIDTYDHFIEWIDGTYTNVNPAGTTPADFINGKKVLIEEAGVSNYICKTTPVTSIANFEPLAEDVKYASEINAVQFDDITSENAQGQIEQVNDKVNLKTQYAELDDITILTTDWVEDNGDIYYDYYNALYVNPIEQAFEFQNPTQAQSELIDADRFKLLEPLEKITTESGYGIRIYANKVSSNDLTFKVIMYNYTDTAIPSDVISADKVTYDNTTSGLTATDVQSAIDEINTKTDGKIDKTLADAVNVSNEKVVVYNDDGYTRRESTSIGFQEIQIVNRVQKYAKFDMNGNLGTLQIPTEAVYYTNKLYVDKFKLYKHKIYLLLDNTSSSQFISFEIILNQSTAITSFADLYNLLLSKYTPNYVPVSGTYYTLDYTRDWFIINGLRVISTNPNKINLIGIGYDGANSTLYTELKPQTGFNIDITSLGDWTITDSVETMKSI